MTLIKIQTLKSVTTCKLEHSDDAIIMICKCFNFHGFFRMIMNELYIYS